MAGEDDDQKPAAPATDSFVPTVTFEGYPDGKTRVLFKAGVDSGPVPPKFAALIRKKGLAPDA